MASAKHGRRGNFSMNNTATPVLKLSKDLNEYIVPNISSIKLNEISILQTGSNLNRSEDQIQDVSNKADVSEGEL